MPAHRCQVLRYREGLQDGEQVVVRGQSLLEEGTKVNVVSIEEIE